MSELDPHPLPQLRLMLVDDHPLVLGGLRAALATQADFTVVAEAQDGDQVRATVSRTAPDVVLLDLLLGGASGLAEGLDLVKELSQRTKVLVQSALEDASFARRALQAGAMGFILKSDPTEQLFVAVRAVAAGRIHLSTRLFAVMSRVAAGPVGKKFSELSTRELHVLHATALGLPNKRIAADLELSVKTIETHKEAVKRKLGLEDAAALAKVAQQYLNTLRGL
jgi:DNA-binding NarL/FixJ family response regulator